jgi:hypothetical protein
MSQRVTTIHGGIDIFYLVLPLTTSTMPAGHHPPRREEVHKKKLDNAATYLKNAGWRSTIDSSLITTISLPSLLEVFAFKILPSYMLLTLSWLPGLQMCYLVHLKRVESP